MPYKHDIFISYKRHPETLQWITMHFLPLLDLHVGDELERKPEIYAHEVTDQIPAGTAWPVELGEVIGASRILIALWSGPYLNSVWCTMELCLMLAREREEGCRTAQNRYGLVVPVVVHDGEKIPPELGITQKLDIRKCFNTRMRRDSERAEELGEKIKQHAKGIAQAIINAPQYRDNWSQQAAQKLYDAYYTSEISQQSVPRFHSQ